MALQCPHCPLKFDLKPMLADHLQTDHGVGPEVTDPLQPESKRIGLVRPHDPRDHHADGGKGDETQRPGTQGDHRQADDR